MRGFLKNHLDPRGMTRLHSVGAVAGLETVYSPMSGLASLSNGLFGSRAGQKLGIDLAEGQTMFSGGFLASTRAASQMDRLEQRIARKTAAGKPTDRLTSRLTRAQQSITDLSSITRPGVNPLGVTETTLEDLRKAQVGRRTTPLFQAGGGRATGQYATYGGGPGVSNVRGKKGFQRMYRKPEQYYFERGEVTPKKRRVKDEKTGKFKMVQDPNTRNALPGDTRVKIIRGQGGGYSAVLPSGESRFISSEVGSSLFRPSAGSTKPGYGYTGNTLASSASGQATQRLMGYMRGAQGYARAGGLTGQAYTGAQNAVNDAIKMMSNLEAKGVGVRRADFSVNTARQNLMANNGSVFASIDDVIATQKGLATSGRKCWEDINYKSI